MKAELSDKIRLLHILEAIGHIENFFVSRTKNDLYTDFQLRFSTERQLEIIGEAANHISPATQQNFPEAEWPKIVSFRNFLAHEYFGVDLELVWTIIEQHIPKLKSQVQGILTKLETEE